MMFKYKSSDYYEAPCKPDNLCKVGAVGIFCGSGEEAELYCKGGFNSICKNAKRLLRMPTEEDPFFTAFDNTKTNGFYVVEDLQ